MEEAQPPKDRRITSLNDLAFMGVRNRSSAPVCRFSLNVPNMADLLLKALVTTADNSQFARLNPARRFAAMYSLKREVSLASSPRSHCSPVYRTSAPKLETDRQR